jgi:hypothetical protein
MSHLPTLSGAGQNELPSNLAHDALMFVQRQLEKKTPSV